MYVIEIIKKYLKDNGYDGLYFEDECGCLLRDLNPGNCLDECCMPGYKVKFGKTWVIRPEKGE